jgi:phosphodiesterase/alkaline phosphatase D-like protein
MWRRSFMLAAAAALLSPLVPGLWRRSGWGGASAGPVRSLWLGATTPTSVTATARTDDLVAETVFVAAERPDFSGPIHSGRGTPDERGYFCRAVVEGLAPDREYFLGVMVGGTLDAGMVGRFRTPPAGAHGFSFGMGSCAETGSNAVVFDAIRRKAEAGDLSFFIHAGDLHYANIERNDPSLYHAAYDEVFDAPRQNALWRSLPMYYMWDDHDFGANASHGGAPSRQAAVLAYRSRVPSPPLADSSPEGGVYYSFVRGRVRFVATDLRSEKSDPERRDDPGKVMLSAEQKNWFRQELEAARAAGQVVCWINTHVWLGAPDEDADRWYGYTHARQEIAEMIARARMAQSLFIVSGDMHALAYDDGGNNAWGGFPVLHAAPLDKAPRHKGGPYALGPFPPLEEGDEEVSQFGIVSVEDSGGARLAFRFVGLRIDPETAAESVVIDQTFARHVPADLRELTAR